MRASVTRCRTVPSASCRSWVEVTPQSWRCQLIVGQISSWGLNCGPLIATWRMNTWYGSITFSWVWNQLQGATDGPPKAKWSTMTISSVSSSTSSKMSVAGEDRLAIGWAEVGEDQAVVLDDRIPGLAVAVPAPGATEAPLGLAGLVEAAAVGGEQPPVVGAADMPSSSTRPKYSVVPRWQQRGSSRPGVPERSR